MFRRKSTKKSTRPDLRAHEKSEKKMLAWQAKMLKKEEKESPVQLVSIRMTARDDGGREESTWPTEVGETPKQQLPLETDTTTTPTNPAPLLPVEGGDAEPAANHAILKSQSSVHTITGDIVTSATSFNFSGKDTECDEETIQLSFQDDECVDKFEVVPTNQPNFQLLRNRLESNSSAKINLSYEL